MLRSKYSKTFIMVIHLKEQNITTATINIINIINNNTTNNESNQIKSNQINNNCDIMTSTTTLSLPRFSSNNSAIMPTPSSRQADDALFLQSLSPEFIAQQERLMNRLEERKVKGGRVVAGVMSCLQIRPLAIHHAVFC